MPRGIRESIKSKAQLGISYLFWLIGSVSVQSYAADKDFVDYAQTQLAIKNVSLIDGTGKHPKFLQAVLLKDGKITAVGASNDITIPAGVTSIDGKGKTLIPGLIMMHEHMFYPTGNRQYTEMLYSFPRLYLAGGATTIRTAGTTAPYADINESAAERPSLKQP